MKREVFEILLNEYQELSKLRERSIKNTEETTRTFITILGLVAAAFSISPGEPTKNIILLITVGIALVVGGFIYHGLILNNISQTIYTRELNITRKLIIENRGIENKIFLKTEKNKPVFDNLGFFDEKYSVHGGLGLITLLNCFLAAIFLVLLFNLDPFINFWTSIPDNIGIVITAIITTFYFQKIHHKDMIALGEKKWNKILNDKSAY